MSQRLYLMVGYPGAGKTTVSGLITELTGAVHLWTDHVRRSLFTEPTYSADENKRLYEHLNAEADRLLSEGKSVVYDTNFNYYADRELMRRIAGKHDAEAVLIWLDTSRELAHRRATLESHGQPTRIFGNMHTDDFDRLADKLESPRPEEHAIHIDGQHVTADSLKTALGL